MKVEIKKKVDVEIDVMMHKSFIEKSHVENDDAYKK